MFRWKLRLHCLSTRTAHIMWNCTSYINRSGIVTRNTTEAPLRTCTHHIGRATSSSTIWPHVFLTSKARRDASGALAIEGWFTAWSTPGTGWWTRAVDASIVGASLGVAAADSVVGTRGCYRARAVIDYNASVLPDTRYGWWWRIAVANDGVSYAVFSCQPTRNLEVEDVPGDLLCASAALRESSARRARMLKSTMILLLSRNIVSTKVEV